MTPVELVLSKLADAKRKGSGWQARCPAHEDHRPSLSISEGDDGRALLICRAGCRTENIVKAMGITMADLFAARPRARRPKRHAARPGPAATYKTPALAAKAIGRQLRGNLVGSWAYCRADGVECLRTLRFALPGGDKTYRPIFPNGDGWSIGDPLGGRLPLYRLADLDGAARIYVCEGEGCCDDAANIGLVATTSAHGAQSAHKTDWAPLAGRDVVILPDNDAAGRRYAGDVAAILAALTPVATVRIVDLPGLRQSGDIVDFLEDRDAQDAKDVRGEIENLIDKTAPWAPTAGGPEDEAGDVPVYVWLNDVKSIAIRWLWPDRVPLGKLTLIAGDPNLGKSLITLDLAARISRGADWPDGPAIDGRPGGVVLLAAEDDLADTVRPRLDAAGADAGRIAALQAVKERNRKAGAECHRYLNLGRHLPVLERLTIQVPDCRLVVIDPLMVYLGGIDSHRAGEVQALLAPLADLAARQSVAVVAVVHLRKSGGPGIYRMLGSVGFVASARSVLCVGKDRGDPNGRRRFLALLKGNLCPDAPALAYQLNPSSTAPHVPIVAWEPGPVNVNAEDVLRVDDGEDRDDPGAAEEAWEWLRSRLAAGPEPAKIILQEAQEDGISHKTLRREKRRHGVLSVRHGVGWAWTMDDGNGGQIQDGQP